MKTGYRRAAARNHIRSQPIRQFQPGARVVLVDGPGSPLRGMQLTALASLTALRENRAVYDNLGALAQVCNVIYWAEQNAKRQSPVIEGGMRALQELLDRTGRHCAVVCPPRLFAPIEIAVTMLLDRLPKIDVLALNAAMQQMAAQPGEPIAGAARR